MLSFLLLLFFFKRKEGETPLVVSPLSTSSKFTLSGAYERFSFLGAAQTRKPFEKGLAKTFKLWCCENLLAMKTFLFRPPCHSERSETKSNFSVVDPVCASFRMTRRKSTRRSRVESRRTPKRKTREGISSNAYRNLKRYIFLGRGRRLRWFIT